MVALGKVVYALANAGMGVEFIEVEPNRQFILEKRIAQLRDRERPPQWHLAMPQPL